VEVAHYTRDSLSMIVEVEEMQDISRDVQVSLFQKDRDGVDKGL